MAKTIRNILVFVTLLCIGIFVVFKLTSVSWVYDLPNDYKVFRETDGNVTIGKEIDGDFYKTYQDRRIGIDEYVAEFQFNKQFVGVKALEIVEGNAAIKFYLVDTFDSSIYGPYFDEESYLAASFVWSADAMGEWKTTTEMPEGAYYK